MPQIEARNAKKIIYDFKLWGILLIGLMMKWWAGVS
jgi:hypothetical protein